MNDLTPVVHVKDGTVLANSRDVAAIFTRRHADVLKSVEVLECTDNFRQRNFSLAPYFDAQGKSRPAVDMTKDGFTFLVMGFTGKEAARFKEAYIQRFNDMEAALKNAAPKPDPAALGMGLQEERNWIARIKLVRDVHGSDAARRFMETTPLAVGDLAYLDSGDAPDDSFRDPFGCLEHLIRHVVIRQRTVGDLIDRAALGAGGDEILMRIGVRVAPAGETTMIAVAETGGWLTEAYRDTDWQAGGWVMGLLGLAGARPAAGVDFDGRKRRAVLVPLAQVNRVDRYED